MNRTNIKCAKCGIVSDNTVLFLKKNGVLYYLCKECKKRVDRDPAWQFTITDYGYREEDK